jgi:hypothetical protein
MPFTLYTDNKLIDHLLGAGTFTKPGSKYVALYVGDPMLSGAEISRTGTAYARQAASFTVVSNLATNSSDLEWPAATSVWGTVNYVAIYDAATSGNMLVSAALTTAKTISNGDVLRVPASSLSITLS